MNKLIILIFGLICASVQAQDNGSLLVIQNAHQAALVLSGKGGTVSPETAEALVSEKQAIIIDVREVNEWKQKHIPGAVNIPFGQLNSRLEELEQYKQTAIITQCHSGKRSKQALDALKLAGFTSVYSLEGGLIAWDKAGLKTIQ
ncbi:MAG: rhodanese-like domain-containing protein [Methylococcales bacterium]